jgi:DNA helicase-2/ATP-dependent DNA helicase PcrA
VRRKPLTKGEWENRWRDVVKRISEAIAETSLPTVEAEEFLSWAKMSVSTTTSSHAQEATDNIYPYSRDAKKVGIRVGSIHSVKGETHAAILLLETYWRDRKGRHNMELLLPWFEGKKSGAGKEGTEQKTRLKTHYVAMTRPTHLLCLAMQKSTLYGGNTNSATDVITRLESRGWYISDLTTATQRVF